MRPHGVHTSPRDFAFSLLRGTSKRFERDRLWYRLALNLGASATVAGLCHAAERPVRQAPMRTLEARHWASTRTGFSPGYWISPTRPAWTSSVPWRCKA